MGSADIVHEEGINNTMLRIESYTTLLEGPEGSKMENVDNQSDNSRLGLEKSGKGNLN